MLQIMSGKFFRGEDRHRLDGKGILYSNFSWVRPVVTCVGTLEPVDRFSTVSGYVFSYINQMEKLGEPRAGDMAPTGDHEIVSQFALLAMFALNAHFDPDRSSVAFNCRASSISSHEKYVPSHFVDRIFAPQRRGTVADEERLVRLVAKAISMPRTHYTAVINVLEALQRAYQAINGSLDLAYSMVVYCLESMAQKFDNYEPSWRDYEERPRKRLDAVLADTTSDVCERVRTVLLETTHLKLRARLVHFVQTHLSPDFFTSRANQSKWPLRRSQCERALTNAYILRSGYVHQLRSIQEQLHQPFVAEGEVFEWDREPYLTLRGLVNLALDVIWNFIERAPVVDKEDVNWRREIPGITTLRVAPQHWIWQHEGIETLPKPKRTANLKARYHGLLQLTLEVATTPGAALVDLRALVAMYEGLIRRCAKDDRPSIMATYMLFNLLVAPDKRAPSWDQLAPSFTEELAKRTIESMTLEVMLNDDVLGDFHECMKAYEEYAHARFSEMTLELPQLVEVKILGALANKALQAGNTNEHARILEIAIGEAAGRTNVQERLIEAQANGAMVDLKAIFTLATSRSSDPPATEGEGSDATS